MTSGNADSIVLDHSPSYDVSKSESEICDKGRELLLELNMK
jgi:hypothetical protein